jgi:hypothetical protein
VYRILCGLVILLFSSSLAQAAFLIEDAKVIRVASVSGNVDQFGVIVEGGTEPCAGSAWIIFDAGDYATSAMFERTYSGALTALSTGMPVDIYNYANDSCEHAMSIQIHN